LVVVPYQGVVLEHSAHYALIVRRGLGDAEGRPLFQPETLSVLLAGDVPAGASGDALALAFAPQPGLTKLGSAVRAGIAMAAGAVRRTGAVSAHGALLATRPAAVGIGFAAVQNAIETVGHAQQRDGVTVVPGAVRVAETGEVGPALQRTGCATVRGRFAAVLDAIVARRRLAGAARTVLHLRTGFNVVAMACVLAGVWVGPPRLLWRRRSFGTQSERGNLFAERLMTVAHTARKQNKNVLAFLTACCQ
jgi:hypothetical protein